MMKIQRIRPQSKRKAINAKAFEQRYCRQAIEAAENGLNDEANRLYAKSQYWRERYDQLIYNGAVI